MKILLASLIILSVALPVCGKIVADAPVKRTAAADTSTRVCAVGRECRMLEISCLSTNVEFCVIGGTSAVDHSDLIGIEIGVGKAWDIPIPRGRRLDCFDLFFQVGGAGSDGISYLCWP